MPRVENLPQMVARVNADDHAQQLEVRARAGSRARARARRPPLLGALRPECGRGARAGS